MRQRRRRGSRPERRRRFEHRRIGDGVNVLDVIVTLLCILRLRATGIHIIQAPTTTPSAPSSAADRGDDVIVETQQAIDGGGVGEASVKHPRGAVEGVEEPILGLRRVVEDRADRLGRLRLGGEEEEAEPGGLGGSSSASTSASAAAAAAAVDRTIVLVDHIVEILVGGDGDERVEVLAGELVLEREGTAGEEGFREARREVGEGGVAVDDDDAGLAADVAEGLVVGAGDDVAAVAAHQAEPSAGAGGDWVVPGIGVAGPGGGVDGVGVAQMLGLGLLLLLLLRRRRQRRSSRRRRRRRFHGIERRWGWSQ